MAKLTKKEPKKKTIFERRRFKKDASKEQQYKGKDKGILSVKKKGKDIKVTKRGGDKKKIRLISPGKRSKLKFQLVESRRAPLNPKNLPKFKLPKIRLIKSKPPKKCKPSFLQRIGISKMSRACRKYFKN